MGLRHLMDHLPAYVLFWLLTVGVWAAFAGPELARMGGQWEILRSYRVDAVLVTEPELSPAWGDPFTKGTR